MTLDEDWRYSNMPFCAKVVRYPTCLPKQQNIPPSIDFPNGRWTNFTVTAKDSWVSQNVQSFIAYRVGLETNKTLRNSGKNEFGVPGHVARRFYRNPDCQYSYKSYVCWINFPRCDPDRDLSLPTCRSSCENFFKSCNYEHNLWRCGESKYFNGYFPESPQYDSNGNVYYLRDYFLGQPFRENKFDVNGIEKPICTPALTDSGSSYANISLIMTTTIVTLILQIVFFMS